MGGGENGGKIYGCEGEGRESGGGFDGIGGGGKGERDMLCY